MQNLKRNWIVGSKLTWGIWRILTRTLENLKNLPFNRLLLTKAVSKWKQHGFFDQRIYIEKSTWKKRGYYDQGNYFYKSTWKLRRFVNQRNYTEKNMWKQCRFFEHRNYVEKYVETTLIFRSAKLHRKNTWKQRRNFSKFVKIWSSMYWRYIHVQSTSIPRGVHVGKYVVCSLVSIHMDSSQLGIQ